MKISKGGGEEDSEMVVRLLNQGFDRMYFEIQKPSVYHFYIKWGK